MAELSPPQAARLWSVRQGGLFPGFSLKTDLVLAKQEHLCYTVINLTG
jgi:hypothetical protein